MGLFRAKSGANGRAGDYVSARHKLMLSCTGEAYTVLLAPADGVVSARRCWAGTGATELV